MATFFCDHVTDMMRDVKTQSLEHNITSCLSKLITIMGKSACSELTSTAYELKKVAVEAKSP